MDATVREFGDRMREEVRELLARGLKRRQIALRLGISETKVSEYKSDLVAAGRLPAVGTIVVLDTSPDVVDVEVAPRRPRVEVLLEHAALKAMTLQATTRTLRDHIVGADEWVTVPGYRDGVLAATGEAVREALAALTEVAAELGLERPMASPRKRS